MDLVDKQQIAGLQIHQQTNDVPGPFQGWSARDPAMNAELLSQHQRHGGFAKARRTIEQHMIQGITPPEGSLHSNPQDLLQFALADVVIQSLRPEAVLGANTGLLHRGLRIHQERLPALGSAT